MAQLSEVLHAQHHQEMKHVQKVKKDHKEIVKAGAKKQMRATIKE